MEAKELPCQTERSHPQHTVPSASPSVPWGLWSASWEGHSHHYAQHKASKLEVQDEGHISVDGSLGICLSSLLSNLHHPTQPQKAKESRAWSSLMPLPGQPMNVRTANPYASEHNRQDLSQCSFREGPACPWLSLLQNLAVLARGLRIFPLRICSQGWARWQVLVSCVNLDQRLISHYSWSALEKGAQPFIQKRREGGPQR